MNVGAVAQTPIAAVGSDKVEQTERNFCGRIRDVAVRILSSPTFWAVVQASLLTVFTVTAIVVPILPWVITSPIIAAGAIGLTAHAVRYWQEIVYEVSLIFYRFMVNVLPIGWDWQNDIGDTNVIVSALPFEKTEVAAVVSVGEEFMAKDFIDWADTPHLHLVANDFLPVSEENLDEGVAFIENHVKDGKVLVHCKAGVGRSVSVVVAYLLKIHRFNDVDKAFEYVKEYRKQANLNDAQKAAVEKWYQKQPYIFDFKQVVI